MYNKTSEQFNNLITSSSRTFRARLLIGDNVLEGLSSVKTTSGSNNGDALTLGSTISQTVEIVMDTPDISLKSTEFELQLGLKLDDETIEYIPMGLFTPEKVTDKAGKTSFTAYDRMMKLSGGYISDLADSTDTVSVLNEISEKTGVPIITDGLTAIEMARPEGYTYREVLMYIAQMHGTFANVNREGSIELHFWENSGYVLTADQGIKGFTHSGEYEVGGIVCATGQDDDGNTISISAGGTSGRISLSNPFMTQSVLNAVCEKVKGFTYAVVECPVLLGDPRLDPWDMVLITDANENQYQVPMMSLTFSYDGGLSCTIKSTMADESEETLDYKGPMAQFQDRIVSQLMIVEALTAKKVSADELEANTAEIGLLKAEEASLMYATIGSLNATDANVGALTAKIGDISTLMFGSASGQSLTTEFSNSVIALISDATISSAKIVSLVANKITSGTLNTGKVKVASDTGKLTITGDTILIKDANRTRVQIGKDANSDYNIYIVDAEGKVMFDATGIHSDAIKSPIIEDSMVTEDANISASKLDIDSLFAEINSSTNTIKSTRIYLDDKGQTLEVAFGEVETSVSDLEDTVESQGTSISVIQGQISTKVWLSDITTATNDLDEKITTQANNYTSLSQTVDGVSATVASHTSLIAEKADGSVVTELSAKVTEVGFSLEGFQATVSDTYATKSALAETDDKAEAAQSGVTTLASRVSAVEQTATSITASISSINGSVKTIEASLEMKLDLATLISEINASADVITLNGNRFVVNSDNLQISEDGTVTATNLIVGGESKLGGWEISGLNIISDDNGDILSESGYNTASLRTGYLEFASSYTIDGISFSAATAISGKGLEGTEYRGSTGSTYGMMLGMRELTFTVQELDGSESVASYGISGITLSDTTTITSELVKTPKIKVTGNLYANEVFTGSKTAYNDGVNGTLLSSLGVLYLQHESAPSVYFSTSGETSPSGRIYVDTSNYMNFTTASRYMFGAGITTETWIGTNNKTSSTDGVNGTYLTQKGNLYLQHESTPSIYFLTSGETSPSGRIYVDTSDVMYLDGNVTVSDELSVPNNRIRCLPSYDTTVTYATNLYVGTTGLFSRSTNTSSRTIKHDIVDIGVNEELNPERLYDLNIHQFKYNDDIITDTEDVRYMKDLPGLIIEELDEIYPIAVDKPSDNVKEWSWNAQYLIPPMLKLIQNQHSDIVQVRNEFEEMKLKNDMMMNQIEQLHMLIAEQRKIINSMAQ